MSHKWYWQIHDTWCLNLAVSSPRTLMKIKLASLFLLLTFTPYRLLQSQETHMVDYFNWIKAAHIMSMVTWFAAIFYLPRLYVYHAMSEDKVSQDRFIIMERKLYRGIMTPSMIATWAFGLWMVFLGWDTYKTQGWLHVKLVLVVLLSAYHGACGFYRKKLMDNPQYKTHVFWRWFNEIPVFALIFIVILVVVKPF